MSYICIVEHRRHADKSTEQGEEAGEGNMLEKSRRNGWNEKNIKEEQQEEEAQGNVKSNNKHEEEECESGPVRTICARALMAPSSGSPVRALIWAPAFEPPTELALLFLWRCAWHAAASPQQATVATLGSPSSNASCTTTCTAYCFHLYTCYIVLYQSMYLDFYMYGFRVKG